MTISDSSASTLNNAMVANQRISLGTIIQSIQYSVDSLSGSQLDLSGSAANSTIHIASSGSEVHGLGTISVQSASAVAITGGAISGVAISMPIETIYTASDTLDVTNHVVLCDCASASSNITINLPTISGITGRTYHVKKIDASASTVIIDANSSETIDGELTQTISSQYDSVMLIAGGAEWSII